MSTQLSLLAEEFTRQERPIRERPAAPAFVLAGDCLDVLRTMPAASISAVVTDPPYGLSKEPNMIEVLRHWCAAELRHHTANRLRDIGWVRRADNTDPGTIEDVAAALFPDEAYAHKGGGFMGKSWDSFVPGPEVWREVLRVLKPGGHALVFSGTRTYDLTVLAMRIAGFEIRDQLAWLYGSGFPKSLDVSKAIDKTRDDTDDVRVVCRWLRAHMDATGHTSATVAAGFGFHSRMVDHWAARDTDSQPNLPTLEQWDQLRGLLVFGEGMDAEVLRLNLRKGEPGEAWKDRPVTGRVVEWADRANYALTSRDGLRRDDATTPEALQWSGWGTALKPAQEPIVLARKPLIGTVAANVLAHGTGGINVDACRIDCTDKAKFPAGVVSRTEHVLGGGAGLYDGRPRPDDNKVDGRWPANVIMDEVAAEILDEQSGTRKSGVIKPYTEKQDDPTSFGFKGREKPAFDYGDTGGASRFFYVAKTSRAEREAGLDHLPAKTAGELTDRVDGSDGLNSPRTGAGRTSEGRRNNHPTVKPIALMRYLVRMITPPGGMVLDPYGGSGSTACAAVLDGFASTTIELTPEYIPLIEARIEHCRDNAPDYEIEE